ncbi:cell surface spherulin 4-like protein [Venturia nashicola]|uniref:Cell surface spherulin 4-like protein n=1 Tax=Venturia nashicola TaxID=86259 RepID=A0A4Z1PTH3_9PEZI|nr:cell surface spherulin 4-like protein [Venturia nashicola]
MDNPMDWYTKPTTCRRWNLLLLAFCSLLLFSIPASSAAIYTAQAMAPRSGVLIPLYIYPVTGAWDPLYQAIQTHPSVDFTVVINPASGPGPDPLPDPNWTKEIERLNTFSNVRTIGYVALDYGKRAVDGAYADIAKYAQWRATNPSLAMQGIFLDESPQLADEYNTTLLAEVKTKIKNTYGLASGSIGKVPFVVMNPGSIPDSPILGTTDRTVVFEEQYQTYINRQAAKALAALPDRDVLCALMHSIPPDMSTQQLKALLGELKELSGCLFLTDLSEGYYNSFSPRLQEYLDAMV